MDTRSALRWLLAKPLRAVVAGLVVGATGGVAVGGGGPTEQASGSATLRLVPAAVSTMSASSTSTTMAATALAPPTVQPATLPSTVPPPTALVSTIVSSTTLPSTTVPPTAPPPTAPAPTGPASTAPAPAAVEAPAEALSGLGSIEIPSIGVVRTMREGIDMPTLDRGPGHWPGTAMPGQQGNVVVAGHRVSHNADFRNLDALNAGDEVVFTTGNGRYVYHVDYVEIVAPDALWIVDQTSSATATLFACHPPGSVDQRIVAHLQLAG